MTIAYYVLVPLNMCPVPLSSEIYSLVESESEGLDLELVRLICNLQSQHPSRIIVSAYRPPARFLGSRCWVKLQLRFSQNEARGTFFPLTSSKGLQ